MFGGSIEWEMDPKGRAAARSIAHLSAPMVRGNDRRDDGQAESCTTVSPRPRVISPPEPIEDVLGRGWIDAGAVVDDFEDSVTVPADPHLHWSPGRSVDPRVRDQIRHDLHKSIPIGVDQDTGRSRDRDRAPVLDHECVVHDVLGYTN